MIREEICFNEYPVEYLVFKIAETASIKEFLELQQKVWTKYLSSFDDFVSEEIWINKENPGEIHKIVVWKSMDGWKDICPIELKEKDEEFKKLYNKPFQITRRLHKEYNHGLYRVKLFYK